MCFLDITADLGNSRRNTERLTGHSEGSRKGVSPPQHMACTSRTNPERFLRPRPEQKRQMKF